MGLFQRVALFLGLYQHMLEVGNMLFRILAIHLDDDLSLFLNP